MLHYLIGAAIVAGGAALLLTGRGRRDVLAETGSIPEPSDRRVLARNGRDMEGQSKNVLRWAPKVRTAILGHPGGVKANPVFLLRKILSTMHQESGGNPNATSYKTKGINNKGREFVLDKNGNRIPLAVGLGQFISDTAAHYGVKNRKDPDDMIRGMVRMMEDLYKKKSGDPAAMARAYYAGSGSDPVKAQKKINAMKPGAAKNKAIARQKDIQRYIDYNLRLLDLYGDVT